MYIYFIYLESELEVHALYPLLLAVCLVGVSVTLLVEGPRTAFGLLLFGAILGAVVVPVLNRADARAGVYAAVEAISPAAKFAVDNYASCLEPGPFVHGIPAECRQKVIDLAAKQHGPDFSSAAKAAIDTFEAKMSAL